MGGKVTYEKQVTPAFLTGDLSALITVVAPASNTKGVRVMAAGVWINTNTHTARVMWKSSSPASALDAAAGTLAVSAGFTGGPLRALMQSVALPCLLPPGIGIYAQSNGVDAAQGYFVDHEVI